MAEDDSFTTPGDVGMLIVAFIQGEGIESPLRAAFCGGWLRLAISYGWRLPFPPPLVSKKWPVPLLAPCEAIDGV